MLDVVIAGGGLVGASLALALHRQGKQVACVDPQPLPVTLDDKVRFDTRATACSLTTKFAFENLGLWDELAAYAEAIEQIAVSKQGSWGRTRLKASDIRQAAFGYVIPNDAIGVALHKAWQAAGIPEYWGQSITTASIGSSAVQAQRDNSEILNAKLLVVADGARSKLRESIAVGSSTQRTGQQALVCNVSFKSAKKNLAYERFTEQGPLALLPLNSSSCAADYNLVWCGDAERTQFRMALDDDQFAEALNDAFGASMREVTQVGIRQAFPVDITTAENVAAERAVVLGNAAQALHPVAGQGFNLGLRDAATLVDVLSEIDAADVAVPERYAAFRKRDRQQMIALTTQLATATTLDGAGLAATAFGLGLAGFGQTTMAKKVLATRASGFQTGLPKLCQRPTVAEPKDRFQHG